MFKNIARLMAGSGIGQLLQFASVPILTRFYSSEEFGVFAIVIAISGVLTVISSLQLNVAVVSLKSEVEVLKLLRSALSLNLIMLLVSLIFTLAASFIFYGGNISLLLVLLIVLITFFSSINNTLKGVFVFSGSFSDLSKIYVFRAMTIVSLQFLFVYIHMEHGLIIGLLIGELVMLIIMLTIQSQVHSNIFSLSSKVFKQLYFALKRLKAFTLYGTLQELVSVAVFWLPLVVITIFFGNKLGGEYSVSARILWPATILITGSIAQVIYHRMVNIPNTELSKECYFSHYSKLVFIPIVFVGYYITPILFTYILTDEWLNAIVLSKYVALLCIVFLYVLPFRVVFRVLQLQKVQLIIETSIFLFLTVLFMLFDFKSVEVILHIVITAMVGQALIQEYIIRKSMKLYV